MLKIPGYTTSGLLPNRSHGNIFLGTRNSDSLQIAIKCVERDELPNTRNDQGRLFHEVQMLILLEHSNIVKLYDYGVTKSVIFLVTEYLAKGDLKNFLHFNQVKYDPIIYLIQLVTALNYIHERGILHLDLNPTNIGLREDGSLCLFDFGISIERDNIKLRSKPGTVIGTPSYLAPEQIALLQCYDERTDIYSLGCVFYEIFTGKKLFNDLTIEEVLKTKLINSDDKFIDVQSPFDNFLQLCIAKNPDDRFENCKQILNWIDEFYPQYNGKINH
ncbi:MAG: serine/threonine-protein kinase [Methylacidiphilales bacterium]|nr:serine/threonine-protein kinase [Candidatus Methylacidiphilales bacterium]